MKTYRCRLCDQAYVGKRKPPNCPFCGAPEKYMMLAKNWKEEMISTLTDVSEKNLKGAIELEIDASGFYRCAARVANDEEVKALFSALAKIDACVTFYDDAAKQASEKRVREVLVALAEIERDHLALNSKKH
jgi:rubrerythrin